jgi:ubiquinone/menaquinone biosynthesis C-methylase UbiE
VTRESQKWHDTYRSSELVARRTSSHRRKLARLGILRLPRESRLLDVACGSGEALRILHNEGFSSLYGVDTTADEDLTRAHWVQVKTGDAKAIPYEDAAFDVVLCMHSLHHLGGLEGIRSSLREALRVLRPGGMLALIDHYDSLQLRTAFWGIQKPLLTPTKGLRAFRQQHEEEWPYMYEYLDFWPGLRAMLDALPCSDTMLKRGMFFFYWTGRKVGGTATSKERSIPATADQA